MASVKNLHLNVVGEVKLIGGLGIIPEVFNKVKWSGNNELLTH